MKNSNAVTDYTELKRLAENHLSLGQAYTVAKPSVLLALIAENERLRIDLKSVVRLNNENADLFKEKNDRLRAEVAGLKTGYEAYERVNAELKAESEALRKALADILDLYDTDEGCRNLPQYIVGRAALGQGEQS